MGRSSASTTASAPMAEMAIPAATHSDTRISRNRAQRDEDEDKAQGAVLEEKADAGVEKFRFIVPDGPFLPRRAGRESPRSQGVP